MISGGGNVFQGFCLTRAVVKGLLLDQFPTTGYAYSVGRNLLMNQNAKIINVRRFPSEDYQEFSLNEILNGDLDLFIDGEGGRITRWYSLQGGIYNQLTRSFEQVNGNQPTIALNGSVITFGEIPFVRFDKSLTQSIASTADNERYTQDDFTTYIVFRSQAESGTTTDLFQIINAEHNGTITNGVVVVSDTRTNVRRMVNYRPDSTSRFIDYAETLPASTIKQICIKKTGNLVESFANGVKQGEVNVSSASFSGNYLLEFGARGTGQDYFNGHLAECITYLDSHSESVQNAITGNQLNFYGIS